MIPVSISHPPDLDINGADDLTGHTLCRWFGGDEADIEKWKKLARKVNAHTANAARVANYHQAMGLVDHMKRTGAINDG